MPVRINKGLWTRSNINLNRIKPNTLKIILSSTIAIGISVFGYFWYR